MQESACQLAIMTQKSSPYASEVASFDFLLHFRTECRGIFISDRSKPYKSMKSSSALKSCWSKVEVSDDKWLSSVPIVLKNEITYNILQGDHADRYSRSSFTSRQSLIQLNAREDK